YPWYGNVRELKNVIKRATLLTDGPIVESKSLPFEIAYYSRLEMDETGEQNPESQPIVFPQPSSAAPPATIAPPAPAPMSRPAIPEKTDLKAVASSAEYDMIMQVLQEARFNKSKAAQMLGIDRKTLYNKLKNYNIE
ncbi:MAG: helix-turn-helix domain-containing protein, partial [Saprospiraceae bacterium]